MNVLPKKRVHRFTQFLILSRNLSLPRTFSVLRNLWQGRYAVIRSIDLIRRLASRIPTNYLVKIGRLPHRTLKIPNPKEFAKIPFANLLNSRLVWFSASLAMYGWFLFQIVSDLFIFHKAISQVSLTNYVGVSVAIGLIWSGTIIFKTSPASIWLLVKKTLETLKEQKPDGRAKQSRSTLASSTAVPLESQPLLQTGCTQKPAADRETIRRKAAATSKCSNPPATSIEIPEACLVCKELISCLSKLG